MLDRLPTQIQPVSFCDRGKGLVGVFEIHEFSRLSELLTVSEGVVDVDVVFDREGPVPVVAGTIKTNLKLECQLCLEQMVYSIERDFKLGFVLSLEQADRLNSDCEPFMLENERISFVELIEDEILLALPDFPRHDYECAKHDHIEEDNEAAFEENNEQVRRENPFAVLAKLKNTGD
ncbi:MAG: DUF177 domain-containing protein [Methylococcales bacterium]|nr:DUF177 domain-containing protein [Methylococcales bacterium]